MHHPDPVVRHQAHLMFHRSVWLAANNAVLAQLWPVIEANMTIALAQDEAARPRTARTHRLHAEYVDAFRTLDLEQIESVVVAHTLTSADEFIANRAKRVRA